MTEKFQGHQGVQFRCPECGSSYFGTSNCMASHEKRVGHCHGVVTVKAYAKAMAAVGIITLLVTGCTTENVPHEAVPVCNEALIVVPRQCVETPDCPQDTDPYWGKCTRRYMCYEPAPNGDSVPVCVRAVGCECMQCLKRQLPPICQNGST